MCSGEGVALLLQVSLSARFFNFTPHFPLMSFSDTHPLILWAIGKLLRVPRQLRSPRQACKITGVSTVSGPGAPELQMTP